MAKRKRRDGRKGIKRDKLSKQDVIEIKRRLREETSAAISKAFNVHRTTIGSIKRGESWKHI
ncbi:hypothetical protein GY640_25190 [Escherichia coli]|nr:hypothetical protein [Escherichia coli]